MPSRLRIWSPYGGADAALSLDFEHTLLALTGPDFADNGELFALNRPLLDAGLRRWSHALGPITERLGYAWNY